jgi:serine/threonine protein kinase
MEVCMSMIGKTLGNFEITTLIGRGGMGEVYQAKDRKLGREVAIKVPPEEFAKNVDRIARFQREAKLLASLNQPNIAAIYGLEESDGEHWQVVCLSAASRYCTCMNSNFTRIRVGIVAII